SPLGRPPPPQGRWPSALPMRRGEAMMGVVQAGVDKMILLPLGEGGPRSRSDEGSRHRVSFVSAIAIIPHEPTIGERPKPVSPGQRRAPGLSPGGFISLS